MKLALISSMDGAMFKVIERIRERALSMDIGIGEVVPVQRPIDIPIAVRKMGERPDVDSILIISDFPELKMEHEEPLVKKIRADVEAIGMELKKRIAFEVISEDWDSEERIPEILGEMKG